MCSHKHSAIHVGYSTVNAKRVKVNRMIIISKFNLHIESKSFAKGRQLTDGHRNIQRRLLLRGNG